ncbi:MAG: type III secretion system cytoplasmic ring protein SctQ [Desulfobacteraceae bacterium]|jgi:type III secretion system YscQ/HrcQ family protein
MHPIEALVQKKNRTGPTFGFLRHQLPVKVCAIKPLPHALPVGTDIKSSTSRNVERLFSAELATSPPKRRSYASRRQALLSTVPIEQPEDHRQDVDLRSSIALKEIDAWAVPFLNMIYCANNAVAFNLNKTEYAFVFEPEVDRTRQIKYCPEIIAILVANNHRFSIGLEHMNFIDTLDGAHTQKLPEQIQCAFFEAWLGSVFDKLEQWRGARIHVESLKWKPDILRNDGYHLYFSLSLVSDKLETKGHVSMGRGGMQWLAEGYAKKMNNATFPSAEQIPFELCFEIGWMQIDVEEFNRLGSNDILLPDKCSFGEHEKSVLVHLAHDQYWLGNLERDTITITAAGEAPMGNKIEAQNKETEKSVDAAGQQSTKEKMANTKHKASGSGGNGEKASENQGQKEMLAAAVIDGLHIDLVFEVGRRKVTLQELRKIKPGYTFDLAAPLDRSISVVANGRTVGKGTLVQIDQRIGVRFVEIVT